MTTKLFSRAQCRRSAQAAIAVLVGIGIGTTAFATELKAPSVKSRLLRDKDVTIIIIDKNDKRPKSEVRTYGTSKSIPLPQPSTRINRNDDDVIIRIKRDRTKGGTIVRSGPKVIIIDEDTSGCKGNRVCVIRP
ncbi:MAG: hypothetical protein ACSHXI_19965 [Hoeflea sp.]|uniref:hypothetical protein n=1 Tax=Hoeflea sp. TaxID=1940281 RepID=UPI003EF725C3